jgi:hypothetical protein
MAKEKPYNWEDAIPLEASAKSSEVKQEEATEQPYNWEDAIPLDTDSFSHKANEAFRYAYQLPAGYLTGAYTYPANMLQMAGMGEALSDYEELEDRIPELQKKFPQAPWGNFRGVDQFKEDYRQGIQNASDYFPTQQNIERGIENLTGLGLTPQTRSQSLLRTGGEAAGFNTGSLLSKAISSVAVPTVKYGLEESGVPEPLSDILSFSIDAGRGALTESWKNFNKTPTGVPKFLSERGTPKAMADLELSQKDLSKRISQISDESINKIEKSLEQSSPKKDISEVKDFNTRELEANIVRQNQEPILDSISPKKLDLNESWKSVQQTVENNFDKARKNYSALYNFVDEQAQNISHAPTNTFEAAKNLSKETSGSLYSAPEEMGLKNASDVMIAKLIKPQDELAATLIQDLQKEGIYADYEEVINMLQKEAMNDVPKKIKVSRLLATKRSINRILAKSDIIPAPVDLLRGIAKALKKDIEAGLEQAPSVANAFQNAEESYANTQEIFNNKNMVSFRKNETPDKLSSTFSSSSNLERLNSALEGSDATNLAHRLVVEHIAGQGTESASASSKELSNYLSPKANNALEKLISAGDTLSAEGQQTLARSRIFKEIQEAGTTGTRPEGVLKLMQTKAGYDVVNNSLRGSPKGQQVLDILRRQYIEDLLTPIIDKNGKIDFAKTSNILKNDFSRKVIKDALGNDGVEFFENMQTYGKNFSENLSKFNNRVPGMVQKIAETAIPKEAAAVLAATMPFYPTATAGSLLGFYAGKEAIKKGRETWLKIVLKDPSIRNTIRYLGNKELTIDQLSQGLKKLSISIVNANENQKRNNR